MHMPIRDQKYPRQHASKYTSSQSNSSTIRSVAPRLTQNLTRQTMTVGMAATYDMRLLTQKYIEKRRRHRPPLDPTISEFTTGRTNLIYEGMIK